MEFEMEVMLDAILKMLDNREFKDIKDILENMHPVDVAEMLEEMEDKQMILVFRLLQKDEAAETFTEMNSDTRQVLLNALSVMLRANWIFYLVIAVVIITIIYAIASSISIEKNNK